MSQQLSLLEFQRQVDAEILPSKLKGVHYQVHSETSRAAAESIAPTVATKREAVLAYLRRCGVHGALDQQINRYFGWQGTGCPRRCELVERGLVVDSGQRRKNVSGKSAVVWIAREFAPNDQPETATTEDAA